MFQKLLKSEKVAETYINIGKFSSTSRNLSESDVHAHHDDKPDDAPDSCQFPVTVPLCLRNDIVYLNLKPCTLSKWRFI